jgi:hypothetical protein
LFLVTARCCPEDHIGPGRIEDRPQEDLAGFSGKRERFMLADGFDGSLLRAADDKLGNGRTTQSRSSLNQELLLAGETGFQTIGFAKTDGRFERVGHEEL